MNLKEVYLNIEDKWFDLLDSLDEKGIPVYSAVDPLEKNGIPSLPVFIALILAVGFFAFGGLGGVSLGGVEVNAHVTNVLNESLPSSLTVYDTNFKEVKALTSDNGFFNLKLKKGDYYFSIDSENCTPLENKLVTIEDSVNKTFQLECQGLSLRSSTSFCFDKADVGTVKLKGYRGSLPISTDTCSAGECVVNLVDDGRMYKFVASNYESSYLSFNDLLQYMDSTDNCVPMHEKIQEPTEFERVVFTIKDEQGEVVRYATVQLVNPSNDESILYDDVTDENGTVRFNEIPLGEKFKVKILGTENTTTYLHDVVYVVPHGGLIEEIRVNRSASSKIEVQEQKEFSFDYSVGATVTLIDAETGKTDNVMKTNGSGEVVFGVVKDKSYIIGVWKKGYGYVEEELTGGENKFIKLTPQDTGSIHALVTLEGEPVMDARLVLKHADEKAVGIFALPTNNKGETTFYDVPEGSYCVTVNRDVGPESECYDVDVTANETSNLEIDLQKMKFQYTFNVIKTDGSVVKGADVTVYDENKEEVDSGTTNSFGYVELELPEQITPLVSVTYEEEGKKYITEESLGKVVSNESINITLSELALESHFIGITDVNTGQTVSPMGGVSTGGEVTTTSVVYLNLSKDQLVADSSSYRVVLSIGLPNYKGEKWSKVDFTLSSEGGEVLFYQGDDTSRMGFEPLEDDEVLTERTFELTNYDSEKTVNVKIPFRIKATSMPEETKQIKLLLTTTWTSSDGDSFDYPETGEEELNFTATRAKCGMIGNFLVCSSITGADGEAKSAYDTDNLGVQIGDELTLKYTITNENEQPFSGDITLEDVEKGIKMSGITAKANGVELKGLNELNYDPDTGVLTITVPEDKKIDAFQSVTLELTAQAVRPPSSTIEMGIDGDSEYLYSFGISGQDEVELVITSPAEDKIYDLSEEMSFYLKSKTTGDKVPVGQYIGNLVISNLEGGNSLTYSTFTSDIYADDSTNEVTVYFSNDYKLSPSSDVKIYVSGDYIKPTTFSKTVDNCIVNPVASGVRIFANGVDSCTINFDTDEESASTSFDNEESGFCEEGNDFIITFQNRCGADVTVEDALKDENRQAEGENFQYPGSIYLYSDSVTYSTGIINSVNFQTFSFPLNVTLKAQNGDLSKTIGVKLTLVETANNPTEQAGDESPFTPLKVSDLSNPVCDDSTYCTLQQFAKYLDGKLSSIEESRSYLETNFLIDDKNPYLEGGISLDEFRDILNDNFASRSASIVDSIPDEDSATSGNVYILKDALVNKGGIKGQKNIIALDKITKGSKVYYVIEKINSMAENEVIGQSIIGGQLGLPYYSKTSPSYENKVKIQFITENVDWSDVEGAVKELMKTMYGTTTMPIDEGKDSYINKVYLAICDDDSDISYDDICGKFNVYPNGEKYDAIAFKEYGMQGNGVYFIGRNKENLTALINKFNNSIGKVKRGEETEDLIINTRRVCLDENNYLDKGDDCYQIPDHQTLNSIFLSFPRKEVKVLCADSNLGCDELNNEENEVATELRKHYSEVKGISENEVKLVKVDELEDAGGNVEPDVIITTKDALESSDELSSLKEYLLTVINGVGENEVFGIPDYYLETNLNFEGKSVDVVIIPEEDNITTIFQDKGFINITGLDLTKRIIKSLKDENDLYGKTVAFNLIEDNCSVTGALQDFGIETYNQNEEEIGKISSSNEEVYLNQIGTVNWWSSPDLGPVYDTKIKVEGTGKFLIRISKEGKLYSKYKGDKFTPGELNEQKTLTKGRLNSLMNIFIGTNNICALRSPTHTPISESYIGQKGNKVYIFNNKFSYTSDYSACLKDDGLSDYGKHFCKMAIDGDEGLEDKLECNNNKKFVDECRRLEAYSVNYSSCGRYDASETFKIIKYCDIAHSDCVKEATASNNGVCCPIGFHKYNETEDWCEAGETPTEEGIPSTITLVYYDINTGIGTALVWNNGEYFDGNFNDYTNAEKCGTWQEALKGYWNAYEEEYRLCKNTEVCVVEGDKDTPGTCCLRTHPNYNPTDGKCYP